jgi:ribonuclease G
MSAELLINVTPQESRVALLENGILQEVMIERISNQGIVGNIYKGKVCRVLPGMEAAFIDIGQEKAAFLHASDLRFPKEMIFNGDAPEEIITPPPISELLHEGKYVLVQVIKDPLGTKGARLTMHVTIPSRYVVLMPDTDTIGVSSKIEDEDERKRLKSIIKEYREFDDEEPSELFTELLTENLVENKFGYIARTAAEGISDDAIKADIMFLNKLWKRINDASGLGSETKQIYSDLPVVQRALRDMVAEDIDSIKVDSRETYISLLEFSKTYIPELAEKIEHYIGKRPIFDMHSVEDEIQKSLKRKVNLKSGGYLIIDQTEAMTTIDVNTGGFVGHRNLEETIFKTNLEAAQTLARQLRLRNLGGIIILDFIDMQQEDHKAQVLGALEKALESDPAKTSVTALSSLGLVEMTRKRTRESLEHILCESCSTCEGRGYIKTATTVCYEIFREILRESRQFDARELLVLASLDVTDLLLDEESDSLAELQEFIGVPIRFQAESLYTQEQFDVVLL